MSDSDLIKLNGDILCVVMEFVAADGDESIPTISAISRTCKHMRLEGTKYLLSGTVELFLLDDILSFCRFMLAEKSTRLPLLTCLVLDLCSLEEEDHVEVVCEMLRGLSNLYELDVTLGESSSPFARSAVPAAIASLTPIRIMRLSELGSFVEANGDKIFEIALRNTRAPIVSLRLGLPSYEPSKVKYSRRRDVIFLCSRLRTTLERLEAHGGIILIARPGRTYEYPHLKQLILPMHDVIMPYMKPFIISAPQLLHLRFGIDDVYRYHGHDEDILQRRIINSAITPEECRDRNVRDQEVTKWPMLESFTGAIVCAYATGLACPVAKVRLLSTGGSRTTELDMLSLVLLDWRPSFLRLATRVYRARGYIPILPSTSSGWPDSLETLELRLNIISKGQFNFEECFTHIKSMLSTLLVTSVRLEFRCVNIQRRIGRREPFDPFKGDECEEPYNGILGICYLQDELLQEDLPRRVLECMRSASTLRRMALAWGRCWTRGPERVFCVDLDKAPHAWDRPGNESDGWGNVDADW